MTSPSGLVDKATSDLLIGPDWAMNLDICDIINSDPGQARDIVKAVKKRLNNKSAKVQLLALTVLETLIKNCGEIVHQQVAEKDILHEMVKIVKKKADMGVRDKILVLLDSWQEAFGGVSGRYPQYYMAYDELRRCGVEFPERCAENAVPIFTPPPTRPIMASPRLGYGSPANVVARLDEVMASTDASTWSSKDMDGARGALEVLNEMLNALDPGDRQALKEELIVQLVEQCRSNQKSVMQLVNTTMDERLLQQGLDLNDELQRVLAKYDAISSGSQIPPEHTSASPRGRAVYDQDEDEAEDEFSQLAHRPSSRSQGHAFTRQDDRAIVPVSLPPPPQHIKKLKAPPGARDRTVDLLSGESFEQRSPKTPGTPAVASPSSGQVSSPLSEQLSAVNPFAGSPSFVATPSKHAQQQLQPITPSNDAFSSLSTEYPYQHFQTSHNFQAGSSGYITPWASGSVQSPGLEQQGQGFGSLQQQQVQTSLPAHSPQIEAQQYQAGYHEASSWSRNSPQASETLGYHQTTDSYGKNIAPNLPPPPKLYSQREQFFQQQTKVTDERPLPMSMTSNSLEQQTTNLTLHDHQNAPIGQLAQAQVRQTSASAKEVGSSDRLFEDLVDLRSMSANFKAAGISSSLSRRDTSKAGGI